MIHLIEPRELTGLIGKELGGNDWLLISQDRINQFAETTEDRQFIHIDPQRAKQTPLGGTIAHGMLTLSLMPYFYEKSGIHLKNTKMAINYGFDKIRFLAPVPVNSEIGMKFTLIEVEEKKPGQFKLKFNLAGLIKGSETPALVAEWMGIFIT